MLIGPKDNWRDRKLNQVDRVFPDGFDDPPFVSALRNVKELASAGTVLQDPSVGAIIEEPVKGSPGVIAGLVMRDFTNISKSTMWSLTQRVGFSHTNLKEVTGHLFDGASEAFQSIKSATEGRAGADYEDFVGNILEDTAMQFMGILSSIPNIYVQMVAQLATSIIAIIDTVSELNQPEIKDENLIPLQTADTSTDEFQVMGFQGALQTVDSDSKLVRYATNTLNNPILVSQARLQYTPMFLPRFKGGWKYEWRTLKVGKKSRSAGMAFQRSTFDGEEHIDGEAVNFDPNRFDGGACFGFMPGGQFCQSVIQTQFGRVRYKKVGIKALDGLRVIGYYSTRKKRGDWTVNKYNIRAKYKDRACKYKNGVVATHKAYQKGKSSIDYDRSCRHAVSLGSVWEDGPVYTHPLMQSTPSDNVGQFYNTLNKSIFNLWGQINAAGPLMYSVDCEEMINQWQAYFETFWMQAPVWWKKYRGWGWKGQVSMAISHMLCSRPKGWDGDDESAWIIGPSMEGNPREVIPDIRDSKPHMPWGRSVFECVIKPAVMDLARRQYQFLDTTMIAYLPPRAAAYYRWEEDKWAAGYRRGKPYANNIVERFYKNRRAMLHSHKRMSVDLRMVIDPEYRQALIDSGVKWMNRHLPLGGMKLSAGPSVEGAPGVVALKELTITKAFTPTGGTPMLTSAIVSQIKALPPEVREEATSKSRKKKGGNAAVIAAAGIGALMMARGRR